MCEFATKQIQTDPPHFRHVGTVLLKFDKWNFQHIFSSDGRNAKKCLLITSNFAIHIQIIKFLLLFKVASLLP